MSICGLCGAEFHCAVAEGDAAPCWCMRQPAGLPLPAGAGATCLCPACLARRIAEARVNTAPD